MNKNIISDNLLEVKNLDLYFHGPKHNHDLHALRGITFEVKPGEILGVVGESGSGKSITNLAIMGLLPKETKIQSESVAFAGDAIDLNSEKSFKKFRGTEVAMIFQDPMTALNPFLKVGYQLMEPLTIHMKMSKSEAKKRALELMEKVGISSPDKRFDQYPFELSGGMAQRVMIAMSLTTNPKLLIADEPTTALDVTIQKQILNLIKNLKEKEKMSVILVTHDLGLVAEYADRIQVMYAGEIVESGKTSELISKPKHPYTEALLKSRPEGGGFKPKENLLTIQGVVPMLNQRPQGCQFAPRCSYAEEKCTLNTPAFINNVRCIKPL